MSGPVEKRARRPPVIGGTTLVLVCASLAACSAPAATPPADPVPYLDSASFRRTELVVSLVNPANAYSRLRLADYATGAAGDWDDLPEWNPATESIDPSELDADGGATTTTFRAVPAPLVLPTSITSENDPALIALGREAFTRYPAQLATYFDVALTSPGAASHYGLWTDPARGVGGLVRARMADGSAAIALTCASCHASRGPTAIEDGLSNASLDMGAAIVDATSGAIDPTVAAAIADWGTGRVDVTTSTGTWPARIPDLRPVRWLGWLHQEATLQQRDLTTLAIRIETLIITSNGDVLRPPRLVALALAAYVTSLADALPATTDTTSRGAALFAANCASCHSGPGLTGDPVPLAVVGTDPWLGESPDRGTGAYRVPSLRGVGSRGPLLHDGTVASVADLFDPTRTSAGFARRLHGAGAIAGHLYGLGLGEGDRAALVEYVEGL